MFALYRMVLDRRSGVRTKRLIEDCISTFDDAREIAELEGAGVYRVVALNRPSRSQCRSQQFRVVAPLRSA